MKNLLKNSIFSATVLMAVSCAIKESGRIDYIYYKGTNVTPTYYKCDNTLYDGLYPSDHWPVYADFTIGTSEIQ